MPTAREGLLDAAFAALRSRPWAAVRMVDVAAAAGVSRQTLYNEFGSKEGLAQALVRREVDGYLAGVERTLVGARRSGADAGGRLLALVAWTLRAARGNPLVRAALTGCWGEQLPTPARRVSARGGAPGARRTPPGLRGGDPADAVVRGRARGAGRGRGADGPRAAGGQCAEPDSCRPMTPTTTSEMETSFSAETRSPRKTMP
jgi:AcrR family transcriptional regulator